MANIEHWATERQEVFAWARRADVPLWNPPRVPEAAKAMSDEILRLRDQLAGAVGRERELREALETIAADAEGIWRARFAHQELRRIYRGQ